MLANPRFPDHLAQAPKVVIDSSVVYDFDAQDAHVLRDLAPHLAVTPAIEDAVKLGVRAETEENPGSGKAVLDAIRDGRTQRITFDVMGLEVAGKVQNLLVAANPAKHYRGQAAGIAAALCTGSWFATHDREAQAVAQYLGVPVLDGEQLVLAWALHTQAYQPALAALNRIRSSRQRHDHMTLHAFARLLGRPNAPRLAAGGWSCPGGRWIGVSAADEVARAVLDAGLYKGVKALRKELVSTLGFQEVEQPPLPAAPPASAMPTTGPTPAASNKVVDLSDYDATRALKFGRTGRTLSAFPLEEDREQFRRLLAEHPGVSAAEMAAGLIARGMSELIEVPLDAVPVPPTAKPGAPGRTQRQAAAAPPVAAAIDRLSDMLEVVTGARGYALSVTTEAFRRGLEAVKRGEAPFTSVDEIDGDPFLVFAAARQEGGLPLARLTGTEGAGAEAPQAPEPEAATQAPEAPVATTNEGTGVAPTNEGTAVASPPVDDRSSAPTLDSLLARGHRRTARRAPMPPSLRGATGAEGAALTGDRSRLELISAQIRRLQGERVALELRANRAEGALPAALEKMNELEAAVRAMVGSGERPDYVELRRLSEAGIEVRREIAEHWQAVADGRKLSPLDRQLGMLLGAYDELRAAQPEAPATPGPARPGDTASRRQANLLLGSTASAVRRATGQSHGLGGR